MFTGDVDAGSTEPDWPVAEGCRGKHLFRISGDLKKLGKLLKKRLSYIQIASSKTAICSRARTDIHEMDFIDCCRECSGD